MKLIKNAYDYDDLIVSGEQSLFGPGNAKLPLPPMLMLDRINKITDEGGEYDKGEIIAELDINKMEADGEVIYKAKDLRVGLFIPENADTGGVA